jgi:lipopolysaccharide transport system permease protein
MAREQTQQTLSRNAGQAGGLGLSEYLNPISMIRGVFAHRHLIGLLAWRDITDRYKGSLFGIAWSFVNPLMMLVVYTFVFGVVFKAKWGDRLDTSEAEFALNLFCGLIVYGIFSECVSRASGLILSHPNYVKKVVFPLEILPVTVLISALINAAFSLCILLPASFILGSPPSATIYLFPLVLLPICAFSLGLTWLLSSVGVFIRDIANPVGVAVTVLLFISGVFFPLSAVPGRLQLILRFNPLVSILEDARRTLMWGQMPDWKWWLVTSIFSVIVMQLGYAVFKKSKRAFADVM